MIHITSPDIGPQEINAVARVMKSGHIAQGPEVQAFEREFSRKLVSNHLSIAVNSGTSALHILLLAHQIGPGDEVIVPSFSYAATANSVQLTGGKAVFADIDANTYCIDPNKIEPLITNQTRAIIAVHLYGLPADMMQLKTIANKHNLLLIEDAAQAHGAMIDNSMVGTMADGAAFSLYPSKNMTSGEGGMIVTNNSDIHLLCSMLRNQGMTAQHVHRIVGLNNRMTDIHAAIGRVQLKKIRQYNLHRAHNAQTFNDNLRGVVIPQVPQGYQHVYHQYTIRIIGHDRDQFAKQLKKLGVGTGIYYHTPIHQLAPYMSPAHVPVTELAAKQVLSIPVHPNLSPKDLDHIITAVNLIARAGS